MKFKIYIVLTILIILSGCSAWNYGYTQDLALNRYLAVDYQKRNFGFQRLNYNTGFRASLEGFVETHGKPEMIYEFKDPEGRDGIRLYYMEKGVVYEFVEANWRPDSMFLKEQKSVSDEDRTIYTRALSE